MALVVIALLVLAGRLHGHFSGGQKAAPTVATPAIETGGQRAVAKPKDVEMRIGASYVLAEPLAPLCKTQEMFARVMELAADREALEASLPSTFLSGECTYFTAGTRLFLEEFTIWTARARVRQQGKTVSYWTDYGLLRKNIAH